MSDDIDKIKEELEEVRRLKESLKDELEEVRREREHGREDRERVRARRDEVRRARRIKAPKPPKPPKARKRPRSVHIDLSGLTEGLDSMMESISQEVEAAVQGVELAMQEVDLASIAIPKTWTRSRRRKKDRKRDREIEKIPPEQVARVIAPLGSEERLRILDYLKSGPKTFNDLEIHSGKTGSSLTHHLNPLLEARYVLKGEVRGTYHITVEGGLAYKLAQWLTSRLDRESRIAKAKEEVTARMDIDESDEESITVTFDELEPLEPIEPIEPIDPIEPLEPLEAPEPPEEDYDLDNDEEDYQ
ncbi:MAG: winged helix-turn-helix domain-containing protein [Candidatus Thorarchaeota archaeon]